MVSMQVDSQVVREIVRPILKGGGSHCGGHEELSLDSSHKSLDILSVLLEQFLWKLKEKTLQ